MPRLTPSEQQEQRILKNRRDILEKTNKELQKEAAQLEQHKELLDSSIYRLKNDYDRRVKLLESLEVRRVQLEEELDTLNETLKAKKQEYGETNQ